MPEVRAVKTAKRYLIEGQLDISMGLKSFVADCWSNKSDLSSFPEHSSSVGRGYIFIWINGGGL